MPTFPRRHSVRIQHPYPATTTCPTRILNLWAAYKPTQFLRFRRTNYCDYYHYECSLGVRTSDATSSAIPSCSCATPAHSLLQAAQPPYSDNQPPAGFSAFAVQQVPPSRPAPFTSSSTGSEKKPHAGAPNFDAIIGAGLQCLSGAMPGGSRQTTLFKPNSTPYHRNIPPNYSDLVPRDELEAFKSKQFEWGAVPEC